MRWPSSFQKFLYGCFGDPDEPVDPGPAPAGKKQSSKRPANPEPADAPELPEQRQGTVAAESSRTASERQQSEQSQSDSTQLATQPTSIESSSKVDSDPDDIPPTKPTSPPPAVAAKSPADPDVITPVEPPKATYVSVTEALEDRRKLFERLRRRPEGEISPTDSQLPVQQTTTETSKAEGKKPVSSAQAES